jgi:hypothetical protein
VQSHLVGLHFQSRHQIAPQWSCQPHTVVIQRTGIQTKEGKRLPNSSLQFLQVMRHMTTSTLLISFRNHNATRQGNTLFLQSLYS